MLIMAEVTSEMGAELRVSATAAGTSVAAEVGRRLERLERLEATVESVQQVDGMGWLHPVGYRFVDNREGSGAAFVKFPDACANADSEAYLKLVREKFGGR